MHIDETVIEGRFEELCELTERFRNQLRLRLRLGRRWRLDPVSRTYEIPRNSLEKRGAKYHALSFTIRVARREIDRVPQLRIDTPSSNLLKALCASISIPRALTWVSEREKSVDQWLPEALIQWPEIPVNAPSFVQFCLACACEPRVSIDMIRPAVIQQLTDTRSIRASYPLIQPAKPPPGISDTQHRAQLQLQLLLERYERGIEPQLLHPPKIPHSLTERLAFCASFDVLQSVQYELYPVVKPLFEMDKDVLHQGLRFISNTYNVKSHHERGLHHSARLFFLGLQNDEDYPIKDEHVKLRINQELHALLDIWLKRIIDDPLDPFPDLNDRGKPSTAPFEIGQNSHTGTLITPPHASAQNSQVSHQRLATASRKVKIDFDQNRRIFKRKSKGRHDASSTVLNHHKDRNLSAVRRARYRDAYANVSHQIEDLNDRFNQFFKPKLRPKFIAGYPSGSRLNLRSALEFESNPYKSTIHLWDRLSIPSRRAVAISLLIDLSGSMRGERIEETLRSVVLLVETLSKANIPIEVSGFQDQLIPLLSFDSSLDDRSRELLSAMVEEVEGTRPGGNNKPAYNDDGPCLAAAARRLLKRDENDRYLIVLSDGIPEGKRSGPTALKREIKALKTWPIQLLALGIGPDTDHLHHFYPQAKSGLLSQELTHALGGLLSMVAESF